MLNPINFISKIFKSSNQKALDKLEKSVELINKLEDQISKLNDNDFPKLTEELKLKLKNGKSTNDLLPEAFALVREASRRINNERH